MARRPNPRTPTVPYRGVTIRLYLRKIRGQSVGWKAAYQFPGHPRRECYGATQKLAQERAQTAIAEGLDPHAIANNNDESVARGILREHDISLTEAARDWVSKNRKPLKTATTDELRDRWLEVLEKTAKYHDYRSREVGTGHFVDKFGARLIASITSAELEEWQDELRQKREARTVRNIHDATKALFKWSRKRGYLDFDRLSAMELVDRPRAKAAKKEIFLPEHMQLLLNSARAINSPAQAALAVASFAGIRSEEIYSVDPSRGKERQLAWEDFRWRESVLVIREEVAKNGVARPVPLSKNLVRILMPLKGTGPIYNHKRLDLDWAAIASAAGIKWKTNGPRHSAITYWMLLNNAAEVANWAGNSVAVIESNYRNRGATKAQAAAWFRLVPRPS